MKYLLICVIFITTNSNSQSPLQFNKRFVECENQWVVMPIDKDSSYSFGYIYIDEQAGLTFNYEGGFKINSDGSFTPPRRFVDAGFKLRLEPNQTKVAIVPPSRYKDLKINPIPDWMQFYRGDTNSIAHLYRWGYLYNSWDECAKALTFLEKAYKKDSTDKGVRIEMGYAYNALGQYDKASDILKNALSYKPRDCYALKEMAYAAVHSKSIDDAATITRQCIDICDDDTFKTEMAYNITHKYYELKDKANFKPWAAEVKKWTKEGDKYLDSVHQMEKEMK